MVALKSAQSAGDVLRLIAEGESTTRRDLSKATGLSRSTLAERLDALFSAGLIAETDTPSTGAGRPTKRLSVSSDRYSVLAADVGEDHVRLVLMDLSSTLLAETVVELHATHDPEALFAWIADEGHRLVGGVGKSVDDILGVALAVPAAVEFARGRVASPSVLNDWDGLDIGSAFRRHLNVPVLVENDVNARGLGEYLDGWQGTEQMFYVKAGTGIGSAILERGELFRGAQGAAGDIGHLRLEPFDGPLCRCGSIGCVEALASGWAIVRDLQSAGFDVETTRDAVTLLKSGQPEAIARFRESGRVLGRAIAYCVNLLNPNLIVIGGSLSEGVDEILIGVREAVYQYSSLPLATRELQIAGAGTRGTGGALGAGELMIRDALNAERINERLRNNQPLTGGGID